MKERCALSSKRIFPLTLIGTAETVAVAVFRRQGLRTGTGERGELATAVNAGTCTLLVAGGGAAVYCWLVEHCCLFKKVVKET